MQKKMTPDERFQHWLEYAKRDLDAAEAMFSSGRWFYAVFMSQQAIEKLVKGLYDYYISNEVPRIHNIPHLWKPLAEVLPEKITDKRYQLLIELSGYYIANRYPDFISKFSAGIEKEEAAYIFENSKELFVWLTSLKK